MPSSTFLSIAMDASPAIGSQPISASRAETSRDSITIVLLDTASTSGAISGATISCTSAATSTIACLAAKGFPFCLPEPGGFGSPLRNGMQTCYHARAKCLHVMQMVEVIYHDECPQCGTSYHADFYRHSQSAD